MVVVDSGTRLPLVEQYRPNQLSDLVSHAEIIATIKKMVEEHRVPHFLFYGPPGTGKTSTILAMANMLYDKKKYNSKVLELNASDDRGIDVVRNNIVDFAENSAMGFGLDGDNQFKLIVLDEADAMTKDAQNALKRVVEKYSKNVRFCLICNHLSNIIPAIQSRCTRFRFAPLAEDQIRPRLQEVAEAEKINLTDDGARALIDLSGGDMRKILNVLQSTSMAFDEVNRENVYACVGQPGPQVISSLMQIMFDEEIGLAISKAKKILKDNSISLVDVLDHVLDKLLLLEGIEDSTLAELVKKLSAIQIRVRNGASEQLQLCATVAAFVLLRDKIFNRPEAE